MNKINSERFPEIVEIYNNEGRTAAYDYVRSSYSVKNPYFVIKRIKTSSVFTYDEQNDKFLPAAMEKAESCFMSLDTLCHPESHEASFKETSHVLKDRNAALNAMITNLISDKLLELSRYITVDPVSKTVRVDGLSIKENGYRMVIEQ